jgi:methylmalonyl-CoA/ethylmalonyl-CoA epimerase
VDNLLSALSFLESQGVELIDKTPRVGAHDSKIAFIHPRACAGVLIELVERRESV